MSNKNPKDKDKSKKHSEKKIDKVAEVDPLTMPVPDALRKGSQLIDLNKFHIFIEQQKKEAKRWNRFPMKYTQYHMARHNLALDNIQLAERKLAIVKALLNPETTMAELKVVQDPFLNLVSQVK
jgi:hypothetical protein